MKEANGLTLHRGADTYALNVTCQNCLHRYEARFPKGKKRPTKDTCPNCCFDGECDIDLGATYAAQVAAVVQQETPRRPSDAQRDKTVSDILADVKEMLKIAAAQSEMMASAVKRLDHHDQSFNGVLLSYTNIGGTIQHLAGRVDLLEKRLASRN